MQFVLVGLSRPMLPTARAKGAWSGHMDPCGGGWSLGWQLRAVIPAAFDGTPTPAAERLPTERSSTFRALNFTRFVTPT